MTSATGRPVHILLVDDDEVDVMSVKRAFRSARVVNPIRTAKDGVEALEILRGKAGVEPMPRPFLILLDLNMPRMNGIEFLKELRNDPELKKCIIFMLTTSKSEEDKMAAYNLNVAGYIVKSEAGDQFLKLVEMLDLFWTVVEFP